MSALYSVRLCDFCEGVNLKPFDNTKISSVVSIISVKLKIVGSVLVLELGLFGVCVYACWEESSSNRKLAIKLSGSLTCSGTVTLDTLKNDFEG